MIEHRPIIFLFLHKMGCVNDPATLGPSNSNNVNNQPNPEAFKAANSLDKKAGAHEENKNS